MLRTARVLLPLVPLALLPLLLTACGTEKVVVAGREDLGAAPDRAELHAQAKELGFAPGLVYVTEAPGFTLARQSVGVYGDDGFSAAYWSRKNSAQLLLLVDRGTMTAESCPEQPLGQGTGEPVTCERDGDAWYRTSAGQHEYAVPEKGHVVRVSAVTTMVDRAALRAAALAAHRPTDAELAYLLPPRHHDKFPPPHDGKVPPPRDGMPIERGDLPPVGDGAPNNEVGASG
ncbi:hypothetical protein Sipo8835_38630 [Streptomyces ipomoeae]|jgi:hypothetical protein|uniref:Uncharacterized protein n=2 Tax=Streptomyces ipomoeae TaxID=103232 RepID=A0A540PBI4_9ACTN|nr:hypothetical protein [Streptomyces ipomoeae]EKX67068.1 putative lipoprotein [Streptomyces ipomoeae 91-03]MDX2694874.1 hypothetical protein [Streptomyces ipomoeae]MDX2824350.1 hypothetical protein [Streptomyces ipomoeae]MDX2838477.1 hypothetical protein [Streptomyces ipomoeae]MDX2875487.1 hypothetical protein [Streptomyces ipomoeae]